MKASRVVDAVLGALARTAVVIIAIFLLAPVVVVLITSFNSLSISFPPADWSFASYLAIPESAIRAFVVSLALGVASVVISAAISVPAALALARGKIPGGSAIETVLRSPLQLPPIVLGLAFLQYFIFWQGATAIGLVGTFGGLLVAHVLIVTPYMLVAVIARLSSVETRLEEAAAGLGARSWTTLFRVTLPLLRPGVIAGMFMGFVMSFEDVAVTLFLVGADTNTFPVYLFGSAQVSNSPALYAAATLGTIVAMVIALIAERVVGLRTVLSNS